MKRLLLSITMAALASLFAPLGAEPAFACSVGPEFDLVKDSDVIVGGRFTGWELDTDSGGAVQVYDGEQTGGLILAYAGIRATMSVDRTYKGTTSSEIIVTSSNTLDVYDHEPRYVWIGASGACGAFDFDPTGVYAVMGLSEKVDGTYGASIFSWFFAGEEPEGGKYDEALRRLESRLGDDFPVVLGAIAATLGPLAFLAAAAYARRRG